MAREEAKRIVWPALEKFNKQFDLKLEFKEHTGEVHLPNGSRILLQGAGSIREVDKGRGKKYPYVAIDEAQVFSHSLFRYMVDEVYGPAVMDYVGTISVTGTPNASCAGPFHDICNGAPGWSLHEWTVRDNDHLFDERPDYVRKHGGYLEAIEARLKEIRTERGWRDDHPGFLREYMAKWVRDESDLVFSIDRNTIYAYGWEPAPDTVYVMGVDVGYRDPMAYVVLAYSPSRGEVVLIHSEQHENLLPQRAGAIVEKIQRKYNILDTIVDTGGSGLTYQKTWDEEMGIPCEKMDKKPGYKAPAIEFFNGDIRSGSFKVLPGNDEVLDEMMMSQWHPGHKAKGKFVLDRRFATHRIDAIIYGLSACRHRGYRPQMEEYEPQTRQEISEMEASRMRKHMLHRSKQKKDPWYRSGRIRSLFN